MIVLSSDLHFGHKLCAIHRGFFNDLIDINQITEGKIFLTANDRMDYLTDIIKTKIDAGDISKSEVDERITKMNEEIVEKWNSKVSNSDEVYLLGDIGFKARAEEIEEYVNCLNGKTLTLIKGNHDDRGIVSSKVWDRVYDIYNLHHNHMMFVLCHYPLATWNRAQYGTINLHGHCHNTYPISNIQMDVGVDSNNLYPYYIHECLAKMAEAPKYNLPDFHGRLHLKTN